MEVIWAIFDTALYHTCYLRAYSELTCFLTLNALVHPCDTILAGDHILASIIFVIHCRNLHRHYIHACLMEVFLAISNAFDDSSWFLTSSANFSVRLRNRSDLNAAHLNLSLRLLILIDRLLGIRLSLRLGLSIAFYFRPSCESHRRDWWISYMRSNTIGPWRNLTLQIRIRSYLLHVISLWIWPLRWHPLIHHHLLILLHPTHLLLLYLHHHLRCHVRWDPHWRPLIILTLWWIVPGIIRVHGHLRKPLWLNLLRWNGPYSLCVIWRHLASLISFLVHLLVQLLAFLFIFKVPFTIQNALWALFLFNNLIIVLTGFRI